MNIDPVLYKNEMKFSRDHFMELLFYGLENLEVFNIG